MSRKFLSVVGVLALMMPLAGASASAQPVNQITYFTFSAPFELPGGKVLPAGKYVFRIADSPSNRHVVQVLSEDQQTMHATLLAIPAQRLEPAEEPEVRFMETAANTPPAVRTWWYPGRTIGHEFIYPREHARRLAAAQKSGEGVLTVDSDATTPEEMRTAELGRINAQGEMSAVTEENRTASTSEETATSEPSTATPSEPAKQTSPSQAAREPAQAPEEQTPAASREQAPAQPASTQPPSAGAAERTELPQTASPLPLFAVLGLGALVGAGILRMAR